MLARPILPAKILTCFFMTVVAHLMHIQPKSAKQYAQALNWFALRDVHTHSEVPGIGHLAVMEALATQQCCHRAAGVANGTIGQGWSNPHDARRTDILSEVQYPMAVLAAVQHTDWKTMYVVWTVCEQTILRMGSLWVLKFCNLHCNLTHRPTCVNQADGCQDPMLEILLEPGLHKTGKNDMLQNSTGLYCHKLHILCGHFALAITTLMHLYSEHLDWHFCQSSDPNDPNAQPPWQEK
jgi:hypothetical protein